MKKIMNDNTEKFIKKNSPVLEYLTKKYGEKPYFIQIEQKLNEVITKDYLESIAYNGFNDGAYHYVPFAHGTNDAKECKMTYVIDTFWAEAIRFCSNGASFKTVKMTVAKFCAYMGLMMCPQRKLGFPLNPENVVIIDSLIEEVVDHGVVVCKNGKTTECDFPVELNKFDGNGMLHIPSEAQTEWSEEERAAYAACKDFTLRAPWCKGHIDTNFNFHAWLKDHGVDKINGKNIDDIYMIIDKTVFKAPDGAFKDWSEYCSNFKKFGHSFNYILKEDEPNIRGIAYQVFQDLMGANPEDIMNISYKEIAHLNELVNNPYRLLPKDVGALAKKYNSLLKEEYFFNKAARRYKREFLEALGCKMHKFAYMAFMAPDPIAFIQHAAGLEVTGSIPAGTAVWLCGKKTGKAVIDRFPHAQIGAHVVAEIRKFNSELYKYIVREGNVLYFSAKDNNVSRLRGDYDGDHAFIVFVESFIKAVIETKAEFGDLFIDWPSPKPEKVTLTKEKLSDYAANLCTQSILGNLNLALAKMYDLGYATKEVYIDAEFRINIAVDSGKHGDEEMETPWWVEEMKEEPYPRYIGISKDLKKPSTWGKNIEKSSAQYGKSAASIIAASVEYYALPELPAPKEEEKFDIRNILFGSYGLKENGNLNIPAGWRKTAIGVSSFHKTGAAYDGWFQKWAMRLNNVTVECRKTEDGRKSMKEMKNNLLEEFKEEFLALYRADWKHIYDIITYECFNHEYKYDYERDIMMNAWCFFFSATIVKYFVKEEINPEEFVDDDDLNLDECEIG